MAVAVVGLLGGCGDTIQSQPLQASSLEPLEMAQHFPVYWLGTRFAGMPLTAVGSDPGGAYSVQYGNCSTGGPETCIAPLQLVSSPDNSFLPGADGVSTSIRGVRAILADGGKVIEIATGAGVIDVRAMSGALALSAAQAMVPVNELGRPGEPLPKALPNGGFAQRPLESQVAPTYLGAPAAR